MSKELRHIHLSSGNVIAIMAADVVSLAREQMIYDCTENHDLHIDPELGCGVDDIERLLESVAKAQQVINRPVNAASTGSKTFAGRSFGGGGDLGDVYGGGAGELEADGKVSHKEYTSRLLREAIAGGIVAVEKAQAETERALKDIEAAAVEKIGKDEFDRLMKHAAVHEAARHIAEKFSAQIKNSLGV